MKGYWVLWVGPKTESKFIVTEIRVPPSVSKQVETG